jgi:hypothetical protein
MNDGGPAFPIEGRSVDGNDYAIHHGMSLRDFFAAAALIGEMMREATGKTNECGPYSGRAWNAYATADAMLQAREEKP